MVQVSKANWDFSSSNLRELKRSEMNCSRSSMDSAWAAAWKWATGHLYDRWRPAICMYVRTYVRMYLCMHACMHAFVCVYIYIYTQICIIYSYSFIQYIHIIYIYTQTYPPVIKHHNGKSTINGSFSEKMIYKWRISPLPCVIARGYMEYPPFKILSVCHLCFKSYVTNQAALKSIGESSLSPSNRRCFFFCEGILHFQTYLF